MSDLGYFGPGSVTWRVHAEPLAMVGGLRALLLQALHPEAMRLLHERSSYQDDPWARLIRTAEFVATLTFGTTADVDAAAAHVRAVHARLGIDDPDQLAWVHACEVDSFLLTAQRSGVALGPGDADRYVREQIRSATLVGVPDELVPRRVSELENYFGRIRPSLALTREAFDAARHIVVPPMPVPRPWYLPARVGWSAISSLAIGLLPGWARRMYRLPPLPGSALTTTASLHALRRASSVLPRRWREGPHYRAAQERELAG
ncbi:MAG: oxygenase MpaB family protein [Actinomycetota bacterium]